MFRLALILGLIAVSPAFGETWRAPRTPSGAPDLQGLWTNASLTGLERPPSLPPGPISDAEATAYERRVRALEESPAASNSTVKDEVGGIDTEWLDTGVGLARANGQARTSWIVDPANGLLPYSDAGRTALAAAQARALEGPEGRIPPERCLAGLHGSTGPPMLNAIYGNFYQIVQTAQELVLHIEMNHDVRIVRINGAPAPGQLHPWMGNSVGRWDGDTLVVETRNFHPGSGLRRRNLYLSKDARVIERFTRISPTEIRYEFQVDDPAVFTQVWRGEIPLRATRGPLLEFACHEGNYSLPNILAGARQQEREAAASPR